VAMRNKLRKRSTRLPIVPFLFGDPGGPAAKKLGRSHLDEAVAVLEADLWRRMRQCDEPEGLGAAALYVLSARTRHAIREGDAAVAALWALKLGATIQEFEYNFVYGASLERGERFDNALQCAAEHKANSYRPRNARMAEEFRKRLPSWDKSKTALMEAIGKKEDLGRSASIEAVEKGLKIIRSKAKPDK
jgi:hypothetical protein